MKRFKMLPEADQGILEDVRSLLTWKWETLEDAHSHGDYLTKLLIFYTSLSDQAMKGLVRQRFELRTVIAALRLRRAGIEVKNLGKNWAPRDFGKPFVRNWHLSYFGMEIRYGWLPKATEYLENHQDAECETLILLHQWKALKTFTHEHGYSLAAAASYILQCDIAECWLTNDRQIAIETFQNHIGRAVTKCSDLKDL
ncbi:hypothetical protein [Flexibacterium corallicola]|uniref:hypothetical protein n=1 Tax=Flexibacterium corallicola TaxID=3037259 RepID=UPI00286EF7FE|nr:hypothetical protein [Pseudovibrio sp. M1P-2-3]